MPERLISADSHVRITADSVRERLSAKVAAQYDDALKALAAEEDELRGGQSFGLGNFDLEGARDPGYWEPNARLAAMDRDGVEAEVLYSEVSAFRAYGLVRGDWRPISRAFTDLLVEFAAHIVPDNASGSNAGEATPASAIACPRGRVKAADTETSSRC